MFNLSPQNIFRHPGLLQAFGVTIDYDYDGILLTSEQLTSASFSAALHYGYNNDFLLSSLDYANGTEKYDYDGDNLLISSGDFKRRDRVKSAFDL